MCCVISINYYIVCCMSSDPMTTIHSMLHVIHSMLHVIHSMSSFRTTLRYTHKHPSATHSTNNNKHTHKTNKQHKRANEQTNNNRLSHNCINLNTHFMDLPPVSPNQIKTHIREKERERKRERAPLVSKPLSHD